MSVGSHVFGTDRFIRYGTADMDSNPGNLISTVVMCRDYADKEESEAVIYSASCSSSLFNPSIIRQWGKEKKTIPSLSTPILPMEEVILYSSSLY